jgi:hypothetical protein
LLAFVTGEHDLPGLNRQPLQVINRPLAPPIPNKPIQQTEETLQIIPIEVHSTLGPQFVALLDLMCVDTSVVLEGDGAGNVQRWILLNNT